MLTNIRLLDEIYQKLVNHMCTYQTKKKKQKNYNKNIYPPHLILIPFTHSIIQPTIRKPSCPLSQETRNGVLILNNKKSSDTISETYSCPA